MSVVPKLEFSLELKEVSDADKFIGNASDDGTGNVSSVKRELLH